MWMVIHAKKKSSPMAYNFLLSYSAQEGQGHPAAAQGLDI
jgi:hypothetical protein